ncbi:MAG: ATP-binding domain-containing protein [Proteobacteria bacterium]|nr:ATP-binding domain-containing protein [Pseudomonadota bacterium]
MGDGPEKPSIPAVVTDENLILDRVKQHLRHGGGPGSGSVNYDEELISLRDAIAEARPEDIPPLVEHMTRIQSLAAQRGLGEDIPVDPMSPYFGHLQLQEKDDTRDVMLGKHTYLSLEADIRIVDWRNAPISRMYYCYDEEDEYEEEFGGQVRKGHIVARRSVTIEGGELRRVASPKGLFALRGGRWIELDPATSRLAGGQGTSIRAEGLSKVRGVLGVDADGIDRKDKHLPEIAALLDKKQFELISSPTSRLIVVQGGAGSGKTTVGLHRIAYLAFQDPQRFHPSRILVSVFNEALAAYISRVLPALGVFKVQVSTFRRWAGHQRRKHVHGLPFKYSEDTPHVVSRLKKHPAMLRILDDLIDQRDEQLTSQFLDSVEGTPDQERVQAAWHNQSRVPLDARRYRMRHWIKGDARIGRDLGQDLHPRSAHAAESALIRLEKETSDVVSDWANFLTDREALQSAFDQNAPSVFTDTELDQVHDWCNAIHSGLYGDEEGDPVIDREDDAILLRLYQLKRGWLRGRSGRLQYDHLMIDEAQDFSPLEVAVLMQTVRYKQPITLAGDTAQKIVRESGFVSWDEMLADLGVRGHRIAPLQVAYRSTAEIMRLSQDVLGPYANDQPNARRHGAPVELHRFSDPGQAVGFLGESLRDLAAREPLANVAVIARHIDQARIYYQGLNKSEIPRLSLVVDEDFSFAPGVEVTAVHQVKGLEFDYVILVEVNADSYPDTEESRHLLHVGTTRAAHQLWVVSTGNPSPILPKWFIGED